MTSRMGSVIALVLLGLPLVSGHAQTCTGTASFGSGPMRIGASVDFAEDVRQYGGQLAVGRAGGPFATLSIGRFDIEDIDEFGKAYAGEIGYGVDLGPTESLELCPVLGSTYNTIKVNIPGNSVTDITSRALSGGFMLGSVASTSPTLSIVPAAGIFYVHERAKIDSNIFLDEEATEDYGVITLAAGFVFNQRVTVRPNIAIPVGLDDADPTFGVGFAFNFGRRASP